MISSLTPVLTDLPSIVLFWASGIEIRTFGQSPQTAPSNSRIFNSVVESEVQEMIKNRKQNEKMRFMDREVRGYLN